MSLKYISYILFAGVILYGYNTYSNVKKYNANNPNSLNTMLMLTPSNKQILFINNFNLISNNIRATNLHGLTREEINKLANNYRINLKKKKIVFIKKIIEWMEEHNKYYVTLNKHANALPSNEYLGKTFTKKDLQSLLQKLE